MPRCDGCKSSIELYGVRECTKQRRSILWNYQFDDAGQLIGCEKIAMRPFGGECYGTGRA